MSKRPKGHRIGIDPHPTRDWVPDIPGHRCCRGRTIVRGKFQLRILEERLELIRKEILEKDAVPQPSEIKRERQT